MVKDEQTPKVPVDPAVKLTVEEYSAIVDHINRKAVTDNDACPVCASPLNNVTVDVYRVDVQTQPTVLGASFQPLLSTICTNCGFVRFFNRLVVERLMKAESQTAEATAQTEASDGS